MQRHQVNKTLSTESETSFVFSSMSTPLAPSPRKPWEDEALEEAGNQSGLTRAVNVAPVTPNRPAPLSSPINSYGGMYGNSYGLGGGLGGLGGGLGGGYGGLGGGMMGYRRPYMSGGMGMGGYGRRYGMGGMYGITFYWG